MVVRQLLDVGEPLAVRRPLDRDSATAQVTVELHRLADGEIEEPEFSAFVAVGNLLAVGGPAEVVEKRGRRPKIDFAYGAETGLIAEVKRVFTRFVGEISDGLAVGRPRRIPIGDGGRAGEVAHVALFGGHSDDLAVRLEDGTRARRRKGGLRQLPGRNLFEVRARLRQISGEAHGYGALATAREIKQMQRTELLINDRAGAGGGGFQIEAFILQERGDRAALDVVAEERRGAGAIGKEIDLITDPHRVEVVRVFAGDGRNG